jgi:hypothetical protein
MVACRALSGELSSASAASPDSCRAPDYRDAPSLTLFSLVNTDDGSTPSLATHHCTFIVDRVHSRSPRVQRRLHSPSEQEITIGGLFSLSGSWASLGVASKAAMEIGLEDMNAYLAEGNSGLQFSRVYQGHEARSGYCSQDADAVGGSARRSDSDPNGRGEQ